jgi:ABC-type transport system involved in multi-copper enzyme maturation permease subunit
MQGDYLIILLIIFGLLLFLIQRTERKYRFWVTLLITFTVGVLLRNFVIYRQIESEAWLALFLAFVLNFLFWLFIGRYNPVGSSDKSIQVLGMDD